MTVSKKMKEKERIIKLTGKLSIFEIADIHNNLLKVFDSDKPLKLDLAEVSYCDTAGIQLLISARKTVEKKGSSFIISKISKAVREAAEDIGIELNVSETIPGEEDVKSNNDSR